MRSNHIVTGIFLLFIFLFPTHTYCQNKAADVQQLKKLYEQFEFEKVVSLGQQMIKHANKLEREDLLFLHKYLGVTYFLLGKPDSARIQFLSLLSVNPDISLDPVNFSPKIVKFFDEIKSGYGEQTSGQPNPSFTKYIFVEDRRINAVWRSALLPGWGQFYKKQKKRGLIFGSAFVVGVLSTGVALYQENRFHDDYLNTQNPSQLDKNYGKYNAWYKTRRSLSVVTAAVWLAAVVDALWKPTSRTRAHISNQQGPALVLRIPLH